MTDYYGMRNGHSSYCGMIECSKSLHDRRIVADELMKIV